jgi:hypothetical protein
MTVLSSLPAFKQLTQQKELSKMGKTSNLKANTKQYNDFVDWMLSIDFDCYEIKRAHGALAGAYSSIADFSK